MVSNSLDQDDLYVDMTFAKVLDEKGIDATSEDFGAMFRDAKYRLWHANLAARRALKRGVPATLSGTPKYNAHANDIDFQIESDFIGLMAPGLPQSANEIALRAGRVMNAGDGIIGGMFMSGMYAAAFFETDPRKVVEAGLAAMPPKSPYAQRHRRRAGLVEAVSGRLGEGLGDARTRSGTSASRVPRARCCRSISTPS